MPDHIGDARALVGAPGVEDELQHQQEEEEPLLLGMVMEMEARGVARALLIDEQVAVLHHPPARTAEGLPPSSAFESFNKDDALRQLCKGGSASDASTTLSLHHLACKVHEPVDCARLLLEVDEGHNITTVLNDGRGQLTKEQQIYVTVQIHLKSHIELLLSGNAHTSVWLLDGRSLGALEIASVDRAQVKWSTHSSTEDILSYHQARDTEAVWLLKGKITSGIWDVAWRDAMEVEDINVTSTILMVNVDDNEADAEQNAAIYLFLVANSRTQKPRIMGLLRKYGVGIFQGNMHVHTPVRSIAAKRHYKAFQDCVAVKNGSVSYLELLLHFEANMELQNLSLCDSLSWRRNHGLVLLHTGAFWDMWFNLHIAAFQDICFNLKSASVVPWSSSSLENNKVMIKESGNLTPDDDFRESYTGPNASAGHWRFVSSNCSAQVVKVNRQYTLKQDSKFVPQNLKTIDGCVAALVILLLESEENMSAAESVVVEGSRTKISIYHTIVDEAFSTGDASSWYNNGKMVALVCRIQLLIRCGIASWKNHNFDMRSLFHLVIKAAKNGEVNITEISMEDIDVNSVDRKRNVALKRFLSGTSSTQEPRTVLVLLKNGARILQWKLHRLPPVHSSEFFSDKAVVSGSKIQPRGSGILELEREEGVALGKDNMLRKRLDINDVVPRASLPADVCGTAIPENLERELAQSVLCSMRVVPTRNDAVTHMIHLPESMSDYQCSESPFTANVAGDSPHDVESQRVDSCNESQQGDMGSISNSSQQDGNSADSLLIPIFVRHFSGELVLNVNADQPSQHLMQLYALKTKTKLEFQYFVYNKKRLDPDRTLLFYGVHRDTTVHVCSVLLGGKNATVEQYVKDNKEKFAEVIRLPDRKLSLNMTKRGCLFLSTLLKCFTKVLADSRSWNGNITMKDFIVVNNGHVQLSKQAEEKLVWLNSECMQADMKVLIRFIKQIFYVKRVNLISKYPPYLESLIKFLGTMKSAVLLEGDKLFIETHVSCLESKARGMLLTMVRRKFKNLTDFEQGRWIKNVTQEGKEEIPYPTVAALSQLAVFEDIIRKGKEKNKEYANTKPSAFRLMRDEYIHGPENRFEKSASPWKEKYKNDDGIELMLPAQFEHLLPDIIYTLIHVTDIKAELLAVQVRCECHICCPTSLVESKGDGGESSKAVKQLASTSQESTSSGATTRIAPLSRTTSYASAVIASLSSQSSQPSSPLQSSLPRQPPEEDDGFRPVKAKGKKKW